MYYCGTFTASVPGIQSIIGLPFTPTKLKFTVNKTSATSFLSAGEAIAGSQQANTTHFDVVPAGETLSDATKCLLHRTRIGGVLTTTLSVAFVSFRTGGYKVNVITPDATTQIYVEAWA